MRPCFLSILNLFKKSLYAVASPYNKKFYAKDVTMDVEPFKLHLLKEGPPTTTTLTRKDAMNMYKEMVLIRRMEAACAALYKTKAIWGFCHLYSGQEAVCIGMLQALRKQDTVITSYRCHAWTHLMDTSVLGVISELTGRRTGCSRGKGGSMHMYSRNFYGGNGIVGAQVPLGAGVAFKHKYSGDGGVNFALYGDGAANQGQLFESFNMAKLWNLPCCFVCENNHYAMGTSATRSSSNTQFFQRGDAIPGLWVNGMSVLASREATRFVREFCGSGKDPGTTYRSREEVADIRKKTDPIKIFRDKIIAANLVTKEEVKKLEKEVRKEVNEAAAQSVAEPEIGIEELSADVYYSWPREYIRGVHPGATLRHLELEPRK